MQRLKDFAVWLAIAICAAFLSGALAFPALAQELVQGRGLICDTPQEVERFISLFKKGDDGNTVVQQVNVEVGKPNACGFALIAFYQGDEVAKVRGAAGPASIVKITIVGVNLGHGWQLVPHFEQYAAIPIKEEGA